MSLQIIPYKPIHAKAFKDLNIAWLKKYFHVEEKDSQLLENCEDAIIKPGGYIFMAQYQNTIVGCFSYIIMKDGNYELGKMAVDQDYQGLKIGQQLVEFAINFAQEKKWPKILLYSSTKLDTALHIYEKYGFTHIPLEKNLPYVRSDVKMELILE
ncbi:acetyltransferase (GNAT) family protein [Maribacter vaceletii]|uniref:Acetyltransferase (GNAT) family protein n=1 Tax=Maribacter vaceletii TaxID=1206816 RepID=A0A495E7L8_9FLAO|nr:GNAT family N-acetyltransferase [Maribacter vaceletii]RKR12935.1 acetyltransferase (GNAT) family protein [Maribacter vaceletii]